jgi:hypothetical protein
MALKAWLLAAAVVAWQAAADAPPRPRADHHQHLFSPTVASGETFARSTPTG